MTRSGTRVSSCWLTATSTPAAETAVRLAAAQGGVLSPGDTAREVVEALQAEGLAILDEEGVARLTAAGHAHTRPRPG